MKICPKCGRTDHEPGAKFCHKDGTPLIDNPNPEPPKPGLSKIIAPVVQNDKWLIIDAQGNIVRNLPYQHNIAQKDEVNKFSEGFARVRKNRNYGYIDKFGNETIPIIYQHGAQHFSEGLVAVKKGQAWGFLDTHGNEVISFQFNSVRDFSEGLAAVEQNNYWGFIDHTGEIVVPFIFEWADSFSEGLAAIEFNGGKGYINKEGRVAIPNRKKGLGISGLFGKTLKSMTDKPLLLYTNGALVSRLPYRKTYPFSEGIAAVAPLEYRNWIVFIDKTGNNMRFAHIDNGFGAAGGFSEGLCAVAPYNREKIHSFTRNDYGFMDRDGRLIYNHILSRAYPFKDGLALITLDDGVERHHGFINKDGEIVINYNANEYDLFNNFTHGLTPIGKRDNYTWKYGYIDKSDNLVIPFQFQIACEFGE